MSALATMARPYCERLAKAMPERFTVVGDVIRDNQTNHGIRIEDDDRSADEEARDFSAFFLPVADESGIVTIDRVPMAVRLPDGYVSSGTKYDTLLESLMAAVCDAVERQSKISGGEN